MYRKMEEKLYQWKQQIKKKPLLIKGAPKVGKTYTIRKFAKERYTHVIEINFEVDHEIRALFERTIQPEDILGYLEVRYLDVDLRSSETLLFLDEIQACSRAITSLKFLAQEFLCDIISSGSMLGVAIANTSSYPVGYVETWEMKPMDFEEFLIAMQMKQQHIHLLKQAFIEAKPLQESIHYLFLDYFKQYMMCGGMPEVVAAYLEKKSLKDALLIQRRIVNDYISDMAKYAPKNDRLKVHECFASIPLQLAKENKKFQYKLVKEGYNARYYDASLRWLEDSGLIIRANRLKTIDFPLEAYVELPIFKVYMFDTGLLLSQFDDAVIAKLYNDEDMIFKGAVYENLAAQILHTLNKKIYYYEPNTSSEIDFITYAEGEIVPIEIKAGKNTRSKSFTSFVEKYHSVLAYRFSMKNIGELTGPIHYYPYYLLPFLSSSEI